MTTGGNLFCTLKDKRACIVSYYIGVTGVYHRFDLALSFWMDFYVKKDWNVARVEVRVDDDTLAVFE